MDAEAVLQVIQTNLVSSIWRVSGELSIFQSSVVCHFHKLSKSIHSCQTVPHIAKILVTFDSPYYLKATCPRLENGYKNIPSSNFVPGYDKLNWSISHTHIFQETGVQSQVESYQRRKKWYLLPPCLTLRIIRLGSRVKWSNPEKGVVPSPTPQCSSY